MGGCDVTHQCAWSLERSPILSTCWFAMTRLAVVLPESGGGGANGKAEVGGANGCYDWDDGAGDRRSRRIFDAKRLAVTRPELAQQTW